MCFGVLLPANGCRTEEEMEGGG